MTGRKPLTLVRATYSAHPDETIEIALRSSYAFRSFGESPMTYCSHQHGLRPYIILLNQHSPETSERRLGGRNIVVSATTWDRDLGENIMNDISTIIGSPLESELPSSIVRLMEAGMIDAFPRFVADPVEFARAYGLQFP